MRFHGFTEVSRARESYMHNLGETSSRGSVPTPIGGVEHNLGTFPSRCRTRLPKPAPRGVPMSRPCSACRHLMVDEISVELAPSAEQAALCVSTPRRQTADP
jgi:hypothetical protein